MAWEKLRTTSVGGAPTSTSWKELGRQTLSGSGDVMTTGTITAKDNLMILYYGDGDGDMINKLTFNDDTGNNYAYRLSDGGATDSTTTSNAFLEFATSSSSNEFSVANVVNIANQEKLVQLNHVGQNTAGAGTAPRRRELAGKWANTSNAITKGTATNSQSGSFGSGSELIVLGYDNDEADSGTNFWQELANVELSSERDSLSSGTITAKKYYMVRVSMLDGSGNSAPTLRLGTGGSNDTGNNYAYRYARDGASDSTATSQQWVQGQVNPNTSHSNETYFISNISGQEKLIICHGANSKGGASTAPQRTEIVAKWANTAQANVIAVANDDSGDFGVGSHIQVFGAD